MVTTLQQPVTPRRSELAVIDCDIHPALKSPKALHPYLSQALARLSRHDRRSRLRRRVYPRANPNARAPMPAAERPSAWFGPRLTRLTNCWTPGS